MLSSSRNGANTTTRDRHHHHLHHSKLFTTLLVVLYVRLAGERTRLLCKKERKANGKAEDRAPFFSGGMNVFLALYALEQVEKWK